MIAPLNVGIAGLGTVGADVVRLIETQGRALAERSGRPVRVVAVTARSKAKKRGLDLRGIAWAKSPQALAEDPNIDCFVELMGGAGDPALSAIETALKAGKSVVTANKALIAFVAQRCGVSKSAVTIELGTSGRTKRVAVDGLDDAALRALFGL